jgi:hypothetical protein
MTSIADDLEPFHITLGPHSIFDEITMQVDFLSCSQHLVPLETSRMEIQGQFTSGLD